MGEQAIDPMILVKIEGAKNSFTWLVLKNLVLEKQIKWAALIWCMIMLELFVGKFG
jgi:hypothetical protein